MGKSAQENLENLQGAKCKAAVLRVAEVSFWSLESQSQRLEGKSLLKFLRVSHTSFNIVIFVDAIFEELFGRKLTPSYYHLWNVDSLYS